MGHSRIFDPKHSRLKYCLEHKIKLIGAGNVGTGTMSGTISGTCNCILEQNFFFTGGECDYACTYLAMYK